MALIYDEFLAFSRSSGDQLYACCPFHPDDTPSFTVNTETHEWFCHGCNKGGAEKEFLAEYFDVDVKIGKAAFEYWERKGSLPFPTEEAVNKYHERLLQSQKDLAILEGFGITLDTINKLKIGLDDFRIVFPIKSRRGYWVNLRRYLPPQRRLADSKEPKCLNLRGLGQRRYYPYEAFDEREVIVVEGEKDCVAARSQGLNAVTGTGGSAIPVEEVGLFKDKDVVLMLDSDTVGQRSVSTYLQLLKSIAASIRIIKLPQKDFVDYYTACKATGETCDVWQYAVEYTEYERQKSLGEAQDVSLVRSEFTEHLNTWVKLHGMSVVGVEPKIYTVPTKLKCICRNSKCNKPCPLAFSSMSPELTQEVEVDPRQLLRFMDSADSAQDNYLRQVFGCKSVTAEPTDFINCQKIIFQESASFIDGLEEASFENRYGVYMYTDYRLSATLKYDFEACRVTNPSTQQNYYVIRDAECVNVAKPVLDMSMLKHFKEAGDKAKSAEELINGYYNEWMGELGIEGRPDLFGAILLTYCSVTEIPWQGSIIKGWLDTMCIGDTRTGKSQMAQRFVKAIGMGGYINGENARRTGVIGGVQRFGDSWVVTWGAIPMNDRGLLMIDEASGLEVDDIKDLSSTRSSGAVTLNKIVKGEARARTRLLWFSNPRNGRNLSDFYWKGFGAFQEFIPVAEDQARFDLVLSAAREDVDVLNGIENETHVQLAPWQALFSLAWSIPCDDIKIAKTVKQQIRDVAKSLNDSLGGGSLIVGVAVHEKLLRLSCAFAVACGSYDVNTGYLEVTEKHVGFAKEFLEWTLNKPSLGYGDYIREFKRAQAKRADNMSFVRTLVAVHPAIKALLTASSFKGYQFQEILGIDKNDSSKIMSDLITRGLLRPGAGASYIPDKLLMEITKQMEV